MITKEQWSEMLVGLRIVTVDAQEDSVKITLSNGKVAVIGVKDGDYAIWN